MRVQKFAAILSVLDHRSNMTLELVIGMRRSEHRDLAGVERFTSEACRILA